MIDKNNLQGLFSELDKKLVAHGVLAAKEITIYGGAALISMNIIGRATVDIALEEGGLWSKKVDEIIKKLGGSCGL